MSLKDMINTTLRNTKLTNNNKTLTNEEAQMRILKSISKGTVFSSKNIRVNKATFNPRFYHDYWIDTKINFDVDCTIENCYMDISLDYFKTSGNNIIFKQYIKIYDVYCNLLDIPSSRCDVSLLADIGGLAVDALVRYYKKTPRDCNMLIEYGVIPTHLTIIRK